LPDIPPGSAVEVHLVVPAALGDGLRQDLADGAVQLAPLAGRDAPDLPSRVKARPDENVLEVPVADAPDLRPVDEEGLDGFVALGGVLRGDPPEAIVGELLADRRDAGRLPVEPRAELVLVEQADGAPARIGRYAGRGEVEVDGKWQSPGDSRYGT
jgi:hypothetical protein